MSMLIKLLVLIHLLKLSYSQRRIVNGTLVETDKKYMVYFVKAPQSPRHYIGWLCGGCIVTPYYILTAASCLRDVEFMYAVAGYRKYVSDTEIDKDECTSRTKKKVVATCAPKAFNLYLGNSHYWNYIDIGFAKVETPYNFHDQSYLKYCSYIPSSIPVNYNKMFETPGTQVYTLGWGHQAYFRPKGDTTDYNEKYLRYTSTVIQSKPECKEYFWYHKNIKNHVDKYNICTYGPGKIDIDGKFIDNDHGFRNGCDKAVLRGTNESCPEDKLLYGRRLFNSSNSNSEYQFNWTRRNGPCQNDHGGPLVAWIGGKEYVIGVATGFRVTMRMECTGPYLYTSTYCCSKFVYCVINNMSSRRSAYCNSEENKYEIAVKEINWDDY